MAVRASLAILLMVVPLFAGCTGVSPPPNVGDDDIEADKTDGLFIPGMHVSECDGYLTRNDYLDGTTDAENNSHWGPPLPGAMTIGILVLDCERVALDRFERPLTLLIEFHNYIGDVPESCYRNDDSPTQFAGISSIWVNDSEVQSVLETTYGLNAYTSNITRTLDQGTGHTLHRLSWGLPGQTSSLQFLEVDAMGTANWDRNWRFFWWNETRLNVLDLNTQYTRPNITDPPVNGTLKPPMLGADVADGNYASYGVYRFTMEAEGTFSIYNDHFCEEPVT